MITTILRNATVGHLLDARRHTSNHLHVPLAKVDNMIAVAYIVRHFEQGDYEGWNGFVEMLEADA